MFVFVLQDGLKHRCDDFVDVFRKFNQFYIHLNCAECYLQLIQQVVNDRQQVIFIFFFELIHTW